MKRIESDVPFSNSLIWKLQSETYNQFGPRAWRTKGVPFYLTCHPLTARQFAHLALSQISEMKEQGAIDPKHPIQLFELGAGSGRFGYLFLKQFDKEFQKRYPSLTYTYTMADCVEENLQVLQKHPLLQSWIDRRILKCAHFSHDVPIQSAHFMNPPILICTYFFDTLPQMLYKVEKGSLFRGHVTLTHPCPDELDITNLVVTYSYHPLSLSEVSNLPRLTRNILSDYADRFPSATFLLPTGGFTTLDHFYRLSKGHFYLLTADQGRASTSQLLNWGEPTLSKHGTFSIAVNYDALARYFTDKKGFAYLPTCPNETLITAAMGLVTSGYSVFDTFRKEEDHLQAVEYWQVTELKPHILDTLSLTQLLLLVKLGHWDPINFYFFYPTIQKKVEKANPLLLETLERVHTHFYPVAVQDAELLLFLEAIYSYIGDETKAKKMRDEAKSYGYPVRSLPKNRSV